MKNIFKVMIFSLALVLTLLSFSGCNEKPEDETVRVLLSCGEGIRVVSENPVDVKPGERASFTIEFENGYALDSLSAGQIRDNEIVLTNVTRRTVINAKAVNLGYDSNQIFRYYFKGDKNDTTTLSSASKYNAGTPVTVKANNSYRTFIGWSFGASTTDTSKIVSKDREFAFRLSPDYADTLGIIRVFANYVDSTYFYYNVNGGTINSGTPNTAANKYYTVERKSNKLKIVHSESYIANFESVPLFYDDSTFTRAGYVLKEYNTKADGTGEGYSFGSRFPLVPGDVGGVELFCIWEKATEGFKCRDVNMPRPEGIHKDTEWITDGVIITELTTDSEIITVPEYIDGKPVIALGADAISGKSVKTLVLSKYIQEIKDNAINGCGNLETIYFPDSVYYMNNQALDFVSYRSFKNFYVNATTAPRFAASTEGIFSAKLSRVLSGSNIPKIIVIAGSSTYQGFSGEYMEALMSGQYRVVNFGTTRTTNGLLYLEAMGKITNENDIIIYAPENSTYMMGECELYWKTIRDIEGMYNLFRFVDISGYSNVLGAFASFNQEKKFKNAPTMYEQSLDLITEKHRVNKWGEVVSDRSGNAYIDSYYITMNDMYKTKLEGDWDDKKNQEANKDYTDPNNKTWASILSSPYKENINRAIIAAKAGGAKVYFGFCPVDGDKLVDEAKNIQWLRDYDTMIKTSFDFDGIIGESASYVFAHEYFYDCAFHLNDVGRSLRTYRLYIDICTLLGVTPAHGYTSLGDFLGVEYENGNVTGLPQEVPEYLLQP